MSRNMPDEKSLGTYQQVPAYKGVGLIQRAGFEILKGKDTLGGHRKLVGSSGQPASSHRSTTNLGMLTRGFFNQWPGGTQTISQSRG